MNRSFGSKNKRTRPVSNGIRFRRGNRLERCLHNVLRKTRIEGESDTKRPPVFLGVHKTILETIDRITSDPFRFTSAFVHTSVIRLSLFRVSTGTGETWLGSLAKCVRRQMQSNVKPRCVQITALMAQFIKRKCVQIENKKISSIDYTNNELN